MTVLKNFMKMFINRNMLQNRNLSSHSVIDTEVLQAIQALTVVTPAGGLLIEFYKTVQEK